MLARRIFSVGKEMPKRAVEHQDIQQARENALRKVDEHLVTLQQGGLYGLVEVIVEAGRITFIGRREREKVG